MKKPIIKFCEWCGKKFEYVPVRSIHIKKYCSNSCRIKGTRIIRHKQDELYDSQFNAKKNNTKYLWN